MHVIRSQLQGADRRELFVQFVPDLLLLFLVSNPLLTGGEHDLVRNVVERPSAAAALSAHRKLPQLQEKSLSVESVRESLLSDLSRNKQRVSSNCKNHGLAGCRFAW